MRRSGDLVRALVVSAVCVLGLSGCKDNGLPDKNLPLEEARHRTFRYLAYQPNAANVPVAVAGQQWIGGLPVESIPDRLLVPVGIVEGTALYALRGRSAPYARLYSPVGEGRWRPFVRL